MKKLSEILFLTVLFAISFAFTEMPVSNFTGIYEVSANDPSQIKLVLNDDHSFSYQDYSNSDYKIEVDGKWEFKNNTIKLICNDSDLKFHSKWKISDDGQVAKSRKGMTFYSLRRK